MKHKKLNDLGTKLSKIVVGKNIGGNKTLEKKMTL